MPATQRGQAYRLGPNRWGLRYCDGAGKRRRKSPFPSKSAALAHYRDVIEPELRGETAAAPRADALRVRRSLPGAPRRRGEAAHDLDPAQAPPACNRAPSATCRCESLSGCPGRSPVGRRACPSGRATGSPRRCARCSAPPCAGSSWRRNPAVLAGPQPPAAAAAGARVHRATRSRRSPPSCRRCTRRCPCSPPRPGCAPRSGRRSSAATSTARGGRQRAPDCLQR